MFSSVLNELLQRLKPGINPLTEIIPDLRIVGGFVRDALSGIITQNNLLDADIDFVTHLLPEESGKRLAESGISWKPIGLHHGTIGAIIKDKMYEITTLRRDVECYGRSAKVEFTKSWREDSDRRDFTVNALYLDMHGFLYDFHNGIQDLEAKIIRFIGNPNNRIHEDYLRILRYFRMIAKFGTAPQQINEASFKVAIDLFPHLIQISGERIQLEMFKMFKEPNCDDVLQIMNKSLNLGIIGLPAIVPNITLSTDPIINLALIMKNQDISIIKQKWKMPNKQYGLLKFLLSPTNPNLDFVDSQQSIIQHRKFLFLHGKEKYLLYARYLTFLNHQQCSYNDFCQNIITKYQDDALPINGSNIASLVSNRTQIKYLLNKAIDLWFESNCTLDKPQLISMIELYANSI